MAFQIQSDEVNGGSGGFMDDNKESEPHIERRSCLRHTPQQLMRLEELYKECPHPNFSQQRQLGMELGLEPKQMQNERVDNKFLHAENARIQYENTTIQEALKNIKCSSCNGLPSKEQDKNQNLPKLQQENAALKSKHERVCNALINWVHTNMEQGLYKLPNESHAIEVDFIAQKVGHENLNSSTCQINANPDLEKLLVIKTATNAMNELIHLMIVDQPIWKKFSDEEHYAFNGNYYKRFFPDTKYSYINSRVEASKYYDIVALNAKLLVDLYLNPERWGDICPTFCSTSRTVHVLESGSLENRSGSFQLVYKKMHALSPLVRPREFNLVQHCKQIKTGVWVIVDVSCECSMNLTLGSSTWCRKHPSGCMIRELSNGFSEVTCIEHVEVDGNVPVYPNFGEELGFGAKRWILTLQKTCDHYSYLKGVVKDDVLTKGMRSIILLARKMMKDFCSSFHSLEIGNHHELHERDDIDDVKIVTHKNAIDDRSVRKIICSSSSFRVPASPTRVFHYLNDYKIRSKWDSLCNDCPVYEMMNTPTESNSKTDVLSILQPLDPETKIMIFQESMMGESESLIVYTPVNAVEMIHIVGGENSSNVPMLASGFAIMPCKNSARATHLPSTSKTSSGGGSLVTVAFQIMDCKSLANDDGGIETIVKANGLVSRAKSVLEVAFN